MDQPALTKVVREAGRRKLIALYNPEGNPWHGEHGYFSGPGDVVSGQGGFTYRPGGHMPKQGYAVSIHPEHERILPDHLLNDRKAFGSEVRKYINDKRDVWQNDPTAHIGAWHDQKTGRVYLDISTVINDEKAVAHLAVQHKQEAYYNLGTGEEVRVNARAEDKQGAGKA